MHDLSPLDRLVEKLRTVDLTFGMGAGFLALGAARLASGGFDSVVAANALLGLAFVAMALRANGGSVFRGPSPAEAGTGLIPSGRRHVGPVYRVLAGLLGAAGILLALWSAVDGAWFSVPFGIAIGVAFLLIAATGGGRVWIERPQGETMESAAS